jgi:hypothetical protein
LGTGPWSDDFRTANSPGVGRQCRAALALQNKKVIYDLLFRASAEDPRIGPFLQQWKTRENADNASVDLPKIFLIQLG